MKFFRHIDLKSLFTLTILLFLITDISNAQSPKKIKNVIMMITDGTSMGVLSLARWVKGAPLAIDPYICGLVETSSADNTIADSAPAATAFATGYKSIAKYVGMTKDALPVISVLEEAKAMGKSTGLVVTCEHPHATPAAYSSHWNSRADYETIVEQQLFCDLDVMISGGGNGFLNKRNPSETTKVHFLRKDRQNLDSILAIRYSDTVHSYNSFKKIGKPRKLWASFDSEDVWLPYDIDYSNSTELPRLYESSQKAIDILSQNENGFFMMIEGSKVDWAAHANDPAAIVREFLAFDSAVAVAVNFAKNNSETVVIVCPDHGNSSFSFGNKNTSNSYYKTKYTDFVTTYNKMNSSAEAAANKLVTELNRVNNILVFDSIASAYILNYFGFQPETEELNKTRSLYYNFKDNRKQLSDYLAELISLRLNTGWTSKGHTGEDVFLAIYSPNNDRLQGHIRNFDICGYIERQLWSDENDRTKIAQLKKDSFIPHTKLFDENICKIDTSNGINRLIVTVNNKRLIAQANRNYVTIEQSDRISKMIKTNTVIVYINKMFYLPEEVKVAFEQE